MEEVAFPRSIAACQAPRDVLFCSGNEITLRKQQRESVTAWLSLRSFTVLFQDTSQASSAPDTTAEMSLGKSLLCFFPGSRSWGTGDRHLDASCHMCGTATVVHSAPTAPKNVPPTGTGALSRWPFVGSLSLSTYGGAPKCSRAESVSISPYKATAGPTSQRSKLWLK